MQENERLLEAVVPPELAGERLDSAMSRLFSDFSRSRITDWIRQGRARVNGRDCKPRQRLHGGEKLELHASLNIQTRDQPQDLGLDIVFEDEDILVLNKPAGLVVHPAAGNPDGTLLNALLYHRPGLEKLARAGIVHRLDKDTTGLMVVACSERAHRSLVEQLQSRTMGRRYQAIVSGLVTAGGHVDAPIGRHPAIRTRMAVHPLGKPAVTHYRVNQRFRAHTLLDVSLETGRTHQIRVHLASIHYPIVGDPVYAGRGRVAAGISDTLAGVIRGFRRQALHARQLQLQHPETAENCCWEVPVPPDMQHLITALQTDLELA